MGTNKGSNLLRLSCDEAYFFGSNTSKGFVTYQDGIYGGLSHITVLKGGPGTGKSTLMRRVLSAAQDRGYHCVSLFCSSDPYSLDGIIIPALSFGIIDGTSPHATEARSPGASDDILDLGRFFDRDGLRKNAEAIISLGKVKAKAYARSIKLLTCAGELKDTLSAMTDINTEKTAALASRFAKEFFRGGRGKRTVLPVTSFGMYGRARYDTFEKHAKHVFNIKRHRGAEHAVLNAICDEAFAGKETVVISKNFHNEADGLFFPDCSLAVVCDGAADDCPEQINSKKFIVKEAQDCNDIYKETESAYKSVLSLAVSSFEKLREAHFALEKIYSGNVDFSLCEKAANSIISELFS